MEDSLVTVEEFNSWKHLKKAMWVLTASAPVAHVEIAGCTMSLYQANDFYIEGSINGFIATKDLDILDSYLGTIDISSVILE